MELEVQAARQRIIRLQDAMLALPEEAKVYPEVRHLFSPCVYAREMSLRKGMVIVGKRHKQGHMVTLSKGKVRVATEDGDVELTAPCTFVSQPGAKRVIVALRHAVFTTYHPNPTNTTDLEVLEADLIMGEVV